MRDVLIGQTDYTVLVRITGTDGAPETGLAHTDIDIAYSRVETDNDVTTSDVAPADLANLTAAHSDWGWEEVSSTDHPGLYRLDIADAVFASGAWEAVVTITDASGSDFYAHDIGFRLVSVNWQDGVRLGLTALPNAAADAAGGLPISDAGGLDLDAKIGALTYGTANRVNAQVYGMEANVMTAAAAAADLTTELQSGLATAAGVSAVETDTQDIQSRLPAALTANGNMKSSLMEIIATALTETSGLLAAGFKKFFNVATPTGTVNSLPDAVPGAAGGVATTTSALADRDYLENTYFSTWDALWFAGSGTVDSASFAPTTTAFESSDLVFSSAWHEDALLVWGPGSANEGLARAILTTVQISPSRWRVTVDEAFPATPLDNDQFSIRIEHDHPITQIQSGLATQASVDTIDDFLDTEIAAIKAKTDQLTFTNANKVDSSLQAAADIATAVVQKIAHVVLRRTMTNVEAASDGDTLDLSSLYGAIQMLQEASVSGTTLTVKKVDGSTTLGTKTLTSDASADPITAIS